MAWSYRSQDASDVYGGAAAASSGSSGTLSQVAGSNFTTTSTSLVNITGLTFAASANALYEVDVLLRVQSSATGGIANAITFSGTATGQFLLFASSAVATAVSYSNAIGTQTNVLIGQNATDATVWIKAVVVTTTTGNITVQVAKGTSGTATVYVGSRMIVTTLN